MRFVTFSNIYRLGLKELQSLRADKVLLVLICWAFSGAIYTAATGASPELRNAAMSLGLPPVRYLHLPLAVDDRGLKLSKSEAASAIGGRGGMAGQLVAVLEFLGQSPPAALTRAPLREIWDWARVNWRVEGFAGCTARAAPQLAC